MNSTTARKDSDDGTIENSKYLDFHLDGLLNSINIYTISDSTDPDFFLSKIIVDRKWKNLMNCGNLLDDMGL